MLFYNKDLFDAAGEAYPADDMTWGEYERLAERLTFCETADGLRNTPSYGWLWSPTGRCRMGNYADE